MDHVTPMAWSPLAGGALASTAPVDLRNPDHTRRAQLQDTLKSIARSREVASHVIALAWLLKHPARIVPILGSTDATRIKEATGAADLELTREEWYKLMDAAHGQRLP
jgi:predicted oxidoreductase